MYTKTNLSGIYRVLHKMDAYSSTMIITSFQFSITISVETVIYVYSFILKALLILYLAQFRLPNNVCRIIITTSLSLERTKCGLISYNSETQNKARVDFEKPLKSAISGTDNYRNCGPRHKELITSGG
jgi:hypothetical protein